MTTARETVDVTKVAVLGGTLVMLHFADGLVRILDLKPLMRGPIFDEVFAAGTFAQVGVDPELGTIVWPNGADLSPDVLRYEASAWEANVATGQGRVESCRHCEDMAGVDWVDQMFRRMRPSVQKTPVREVGDLRWLTTGKDVHRGDRIEAILTVAPTAGFKPPRILYVYEPHPRTRATSVVKHPLLKDDLSGSR